MWHVACASVLTPCLLITYSVHTHRHAVRNSKWEQGSHSQGLVPPCQQSLKSFSAEKQGGRLCSQGKERREDRAQVATQNFATASDRSSSPDRPLVSHHSMECLCPGSPARETLDKPRQLLRRPLAGFLALGPRTMTPGSVPCEPKGAQG